MLKVRERGAKAAKRPRHAEQHPQLLEARRDLDRLHSFGHEIGPPGQRCERELVARQRRQPAQEVLNVGLVAGTVTAEHVCVDDDELAHATPA